MNLQRRLLLIGIAASLPTAYVAAQTVEWLRMRDLRTTLEQVVSLQINPQVKERCESDPTWFLTGALEGRPRPTDPKPTDPEALPPRPRVEPHAYDLFAYDDELTATSPAAPRLSSDVKLALRAGAASVTRPYESPAGEGVQIAAKTGWTGGPCAILLGRMEPPWSQRTQWWSIFLLVGLATAGLVVGAGWPTSLRVRRVAEAARGAMASEWKVTVPAEGQDELTAVGAVLNEASADLRRRIADVRDRDETHRRLLARLQREAAEPLDALLPRMADSARRAADPSAVESLRQVTSAALHLGNLIQAARLRMHLGPTAGAQVGVNDLLTRIAARFTPIAAALGVTLEITRPTSAVTTVGDEPLFEQAIANVVDNAIRYNRPGGHVRVSLAAEPRGFLLRIADDGPGMSDETLTEVTAIRRFRGDEGRTDQPRARGLGLALVWEVAERFNLQLAIRHAAGGGTEVDLART